MQSQSALKGSKLQEKLKENIKSKWNNLDGNQKLIINKIWGVITFKWQWQVALNGPFLMIWILDRTIPTVHKFDMKLLAFTPIPDWLRAGLGII